MTDGELKFAFWNNHDHYHDQMNVVGCVCFSFSTMISMMNDDENQKRVLHYSEMTIQARLLRKKTLVDVTMNRENLVDDDCCDWNNVNSTLMLLKIRTLILRKD